MGVLALDDRDATIVYSSGWGQTGSRDEFNSTTTFTSTVGATAKVTFFGSAITVRGTIAPSINGKPSSSYAIDGGAAVPFQGNPSFINAQYNQVFFTSPVLPDASHTLTITNTGQDAPLFLDLLLVTPPTTPQVTTVTTTSTPSAVTSARIVTVTQSSASTAVAGNASTESAATSSGNSNTAAIAGGIIGALGFIILLIFGGLFYRRRQRRMAGHTDSTFWVRTTKGESGMDAKPLPLAPQFRPHAYLSQPVMSQTNRPAYEPWQQYPAQASGQYSPPSTYAPQPPPQSDLAYYNSNDTADAYGGYVGTYPDPSSGNVGPSGRTRVKLDD